MKKYFLFDDEPINGTSYLLRIFGGTFLIIIFVGFWMLAATGYKRAGTFGWSKQLRIFCSVAIPIHVIFNVLSEELTNADQTLSLLILGFGILHFILIWKNGNKNLFK